MNHYNDRECLTPGDNPTLGLILCTDKNDAVVRYTLGPEKEKKIFASRYKLLLPSEAELKAELLRELKRALSALQHFSVSAFPCGRTLDLSPPKPS